MPESFHLSDFLESVRDNKVIDGAKIVNQLLRKLIDIIRIVTKLLKCRHNKLLVIEGIVYVKAYIQYITAKSE
jgi:hypothetical protein